MDTYLYKYGDKKSVGLYENKEIIYHKKTRSLTAITKFGTLTFNDSSKRNILKNCFKNRKKFEWFNEEIFQQIIYKDKQQKYRDSFEKNKRIQITL